MNNSIKLYPVINLAKEDLTEFLSESQIKELTDDQMDKIAKLTGNILLDFYWSILEEVSETVIKEKK
jgi:hypothetical protein